MESLGPDLRPTRLVWKNVGYSLMTWTIVYLCVAFGIKWTGRITYFTSKLSLNVQRLYGDDDIARITANNLLVLLLST
jgi:hypothetical protein